MFADMPLDIRTVDLDAAIAAGFGLLGPFGSIVAARNDLIFRGGGMFCNIEPQKCQYD